MLSTPPAFVLSQDQTLNLKSCIACSIYLSYDISILTIFIYSRCFWLRNIFRTFRYFISYDMLSFSRLVVLYTGYIVLRFAFPLFNFQGPFLLLLPKQLYYIIMSSLCCQFLLSSCLRSFKSLVRDFRERLIILSCLKKYVNIFL